MSEKFYTILPSPLGELAITSNGEAITGLFPPKNSHYAKVNGVHNPKPFQEAIKQLNEYFTGKRREFTLPLALEGTEFQKRVWQALQTIKYGETKSYGQLAKFLGDAKASRAVGTANGKNPICIIIPCHRVINANGKLGGYNGGLDVKEWLLKHEQNIE